MMGAGLPRFIDGTVEFVHSSIIIKVPRLSEALRPGQLCRHAHFRLQYLDTFYSHADFPVSSVVFLTCTSNIMTGVLAEIP